MTILSYLEGLSAFISLISSFQVGLAALTCLVMPLKDDCRERNLVSFMALINVVFWVRNCRNTDSLASCIRWTKEYGTVQTF